MNLIDIAVLVLVAAAVIGVMICMLRRRKKSGRDDFCAGGCQGCPYAPSDCGEKREREKH